MRHAVAWPERVANSDPPKVRIIYADLRAQKPSAEFGTNVTVSRLGLGMAALGRPGYINLGHGEDLGDTKDGPCTYEPSSSGPRKRTSREITMSGSMRRPSGGCSARHPLGVSSRTILRQ